MFILKFGILLHYLKEEQIQSNQESSTIIIIERNGSFLIYKSKF